MAVKIKKHAGSAQGPAGKRTDNDRDKEDAAVVG
jgi:hypothetical protein